MQQPARQAVLEVEQVEAGDALHTAAVVFVVLHHALVAEDAVGLDGGKCFGKQSPQFVDPVFTHVPRVACERHRSVGRGEDQPSARPQHTGDFTHERCVVVDVQASGVLGSENDVLDAILGGSTSIDISRISAFALTSYGCNKSKLLSIPFTFENRAHFWNFANSDLAPEFLNEPQELGLPVRGVFYGEEGFRHFFTVNPVSGIDDFKGLKLRVSNDPVMNGLVEGLGANPTVVSFGELYSALQTGVVDGAEQPIANYKSNAFPEVANNLILDGHTLGAVQAVITDNAWGKLTENQQAAIMEAGADTQAFNADLSETAENKVLDELKSSGCNVVDVPDKAPWQEACQKVISENTSDQAELYQQLLDMKA